MLQEEALVKMDSLIRNGISDPNVMIEGMNTIFQSDSAVIIHCTIRYVNKFGGYNKQQIEYVYGFDQIGEKKHYLSDINDFETVVRNEECLNELDGGHSGIDSIQQIQSKVIQSLKRYGLTVK